MEYYLDFYDNDMIKVSVILLELRKIVLIEVTQTQKVKDGMYSL